MDPLAGLTVEDVPLARIAAAVGKSTHDTRKLETENLLSLPVPTLSPAEQARFVDDFQRLRARTSALEQRMEAVAAEAEQILPALLAESFGDG
jgi:hypothetical protein